MPQITERKNARDDEKKAYIVSLLLEQGYGTYARRLQEFDLVVADFYHGHTIEIAAMFPDTGEIVINPGFFEEAESQSVKDRISLVIRHELLHFLLVHERRLYEHLKKVDPEFEKTYRDPTIGQIANIAMD